MVKSVVVTNVMVKSVLASSREQGLLCSVCNDQFIILNHQQASVY